MNDYAVKTAADSVEIQRLLPGPIERVWAFLTESEQRRKWLASGDMELRPGGKVHLHFHHSELSPHQEPIPERYQAMEDGHDSYGHVIESAPPHRLSFTWDEGDAEPSEVTFALSPRGDEVLLVVTHRRLPDRATMLGVAGGWHTHLDILVDHLNGNVPAPFWARHGALEAEYAQRFGA